MCLSWGTGVQPNARGEVLGPGVPDMLGEDDVLDIGMEGVGGAGGAHPGMLVPQHPCPTHHLPESELSVRSHPLLEIKILG